MCSYKYTFICQRCQEVEKMVTQEYFIKFTAYNHRFKNNKESQLYKERLRAHDSYCYIFYNINKVYGTTDRRVTHRDVVKTGSNPQEKVHPILTEDLAMRSF